MPGGCRQLLYPEDLVWLERRQLLASSGRERRAHSLPLFASIGSFVNDRERCACLPQRTPGLGRPTRQIVQPFREQLVLRRGAAAIAVDERVLVPDRAEHVPNVK